MKKEKLTRIGNPFKNPKEKLIIFAGILLSVFTLVVLIGGSYLKSNNLLKIYNLSDTRYNLAKIHLQIEDDLINNVNEKPLLSPLTETKKSLSNLIASKDVNIFFDKTKLSYEVGLILNKIQAYENLSKKEQNLKHDLFFNDLTKRFDSLRFTLSNSLSNNLKLLYLIQTTLFALIIIYIILTSLNIGAHRKKAITLLAQLKMRNKELDEYAHVVSHDLKAPLRNINALANWVKSDYSNVIDKQGIETLNLILQNTEQMEAFICNILNYSAIDKPNTQSHKVDLNQMVNQIIGTIKAPKNIKINIVNKLPVLNGDTFRLVQLFQNIIQNAVKYSKPTGGEIKIGVEDIENCWQFYVKDQGIGIEKKNQSKIFNVFSKFTNKRDSTGIGLSIVKKVISYYNCKIWVESELNVGTTFYFTLPKLKKKTFFEENFSLENGKLATA